MIDISRIVQPFRILPGVWKVFLVRMPLLEGAAFVSGQCGGP
jgi:hypothetical protein